MSIHQCPYCDHPNPADARFCGECGRELPTGETCPTCGFGGNPSEAEFCIQCGAPIQAGRGTPILAWVAGGFLVSVLATAVVLWQLGVVTFPTPAILPGGGDRSEPTRERIARESSEVTQESPTEAPTLIVPSSTPSPGPEPTAQSSATPTSEPTATLAPTSTPMTTPTPRPTHTSPPAATPSPIPIPSSTPCSFDPYAGFAGIWRDERDRLGCPAAPATINLWMAEEGFERGYMLWREDNDQIYVLFDSGYWARYDDVWVEGDPEYTCGTPQSPPTPKRGFGKIWCTYQNVRDGLGDAVTTEQGYNGVVQAFSDGLIMRAGRTYVLYSDGTWR